MHRKAHLYRIAAVGYINTLVAGDKALPSNFDIE